MTNSLKASIEDGEQLFNDGCFIKSSTRFRDGLVAGIKVPAAEQTYFQWEIDSLTLYERSMIDKPNTVRCACAGVMVRQGAYNNTFKCISCGSTHTTFVSHTCSLCGAQQEGHERFVGHRLRAHDLLTLTACGADGCSGNR